jgi:two-component system nitrogen regulation sensor histidine kinase GlnL
MTTFAGLDLLTSAVLLIHQDGSIVHANVAAQQLLERPLKQIQQRKLNDIFINGDALLSGFELALAQQFTDRRQDLSLQRIGRETLHVHAVISSLDLPETPILIEMHENVQQLKTDREERFIDQQKENKELIRNLAHEIKNPLGGIKGSAQLLEFEFSDLGLHEAQAKELSEYTQIIIKEADRLQSLVDRLLEPHRVAQHIVDVNIHEVCEHVLRLIQVEFPQGLHIKRDYDLSIPEFRGDYQHLVQALLNIAQNAAHALQEKMQEGLAELKFKTRVVRQITIAKIRYKLALDLHIIDNGCGIADDIAERIFYPLVTGKSGGTGLGLTLAQAFVTQHAGAVEFESNANGTDFRILIPLL